MVDRSIATAVFCVCSAILAVLLRQHCREQSMMIALASCTAVIGGFIAVFSPVVTEIGEIFSGAGISDSYLSLIFKATAICLITQITCEICRDSGETAIASAAEIWGRGAVTFISLPLVKALLEQINGIF
ncbi:MAG: stage III sporulation AC/AD family protein [Ruminococcus flavefaciens]|nr:stage III sporulation AC/AD family protein [Ruminococcus flavefaciens]MCM1229730.1 stage III sporulation AC/AD family protein [Ruminococcus flavefaciens]